MRVIRAAAMAIGVLLAHQAQASSFIVLGGEPVREPRSMISLGKPSSIVALGAAQPQAPDRSIETAALPQTTQGSSGLRPTNVADEPEAAMVRPWPPAPSRSLLALGEPAAVVQVATAQSRRPPVLPTVFRGGLAGSAYPVAATPARQAVTEQQVVEKPVAETPAKKQSDRKQETNPQAETQPVVAERKDAPAGRSDRDSPPVPDAPPVVPATPPPVVRLE
jgi:hypothetical protein